MRDSRFVGATGNDQHHHPPYPEVLSGFAHDPSRSGALGADCISQEPAMTRTTEILFVDPRVDDIATLLAGVRPEVEPILLDAERPPARQMAEANPGRAGLGAVHVVAHGAPGRCSSPR